MVSICLAFRENVTTSVLRCHCCYGAVSGRDMLIMLVIQTGSSVTSGTGFVILGRDSCCSASELTVLLLLVLQSLSQSVVL